MSENKFSTLAFFGLDPLPPSIPDSPFDCIWRDTKNLFHHAKLLPSIVRQFETKHRLDELCMHGPTMTSLLYLSFWSVVEIVPMIVTFMFAFIVAAIISVFTALHSVLIWRPVQGKQYQVFPDSLPASHTFNPQHRWVYINGIATTKDTLAQEIAYIHQLFHNPVVGVNNRTYGVLGDLFECIIQRSLGYHTKETRLAYKLIKSYLLQESPSVSKVILIGHSQGGILVSHVLDSLLLDSDVSPSHLAKLEIYTFGSAALTMNNPFINTTRTERMVKVIEHYCNEEDMVTSWGALSSSMANKRDHYTSNHIELDTKTNDNLYLPFMGKVFVRKGRTGHMLNQHYLRTMFDDDSNQASNNTNVKNVAYLESAVQRINAPTDTEFNITTQLDCDARYEVIPRRANHQAGEQCVKTVSGLWKYMSGQEV